MAFDVGQDEPGTTPGGETIPADGQFVRVQKILVGGQLKDVGFRAMPSADPDRHQAACTLLNRRYGWRGYGSSHSIPTGAHHTTFTTEIDGEVVGTITLAIDSARGLMIDRHYADEADSTRRSDGLRICELIRLAFDPQVRSKEVMAGLFHLAYIYGTEISDCTDLFIEVHPRHAGFYEAMLEFQAVGGRTLNATVGVPSQLMRLKVDLIRQRIAELAGSSASRADRSLYPYFFPQVVELQIRAGLSLGRLKGVDVVSGGSSAEVLQDEAGEAPSQLATWRTRETPRVGPRDRRTVGSARSRWMSTRTSAARRS